MTWTYDATDLSTDLAKVRTDIGDTNSNDQGLSDEVIQHYIDTVGTLPGATLRAARALYAKWIRDVDRTNLGMSATRSQKLQNLRELIDDLKKARQFRAVPYVGGVSLANKDSLAADSDLVQPHARRGQFDNG